MANEKKTSLSGDEKMELCNTLTAILAYTEKLLPSIFRRKVVKDINPRHLNTNQKKTKELDALALLLTQAQSQTTAVMGSISPRGLSLVALPNTDSSTESSSRDPSSPSADAIVSQNILPTDRPDSFRVLPLGRASPIEDFTSLIDHFYGQEKDKRRRDVPFADHAATLVAILSSPPSPNSDPFFQLFERNKLDCFVLTASAEKIRFIAEHQTTKQVVRWLKQKALASFDSSEWTKYIPNFAKATKTVTPIVPDPLSLPKFEAIKAKLAAFPIAPESPTVHNLAPNHMITVANNSQYFWESSPYLYHIALYCAVSRYIHYIKQIISSLTLSRKGAKEAALESALQSATYFGSALAEFSRSPVLSLHLGCFDDAPDVWDRYATEKDEEGASSAGKDEILEDKNENIAKDDDGDGVSAGTQPLHDDEGVQGEPDDGDLQNSLEHLKPHEQVVKVVQLLASQASAVKIIFEYLKRFPGQPKFDVSIVSPPGVNPKMMDAKSAIRHAYLHSDYNYDYNEEEGREKLTAAVDKAYQDLEDVGKTNRKGRYIWEFIKTGTGIEMLSHCECSLGLVKQFPNLLSGDPDSIERIIPSISNAQPIFGISQMSCPACAKFLEILHAKGPSSSQPFKVSDIHRIWSFWTFPKLTLDVAGLELDEIQDALIDFFSSELVEKLKSLSHAKSDADHSTESTPILAPSDSRDEGSPLFKF